MKGNKNIVKATLAAIAFLITFFPIAAKNNIVNADEDCNRREIFLTFDDGPSLVTVKALNVLKDHGVKATFFVCGKNVKDWPEVTMRIIREGHTIGVHSNTHNYKQIYASPQALEDDIKACICEIKAISSSFTPYVYRFPGGSFGLPDEFKNVPKSLKLKAVDWNASCRDCELTAPSADDLVFCAKQTSAQKNSVILLMHDAPTKSATASALPEIIQHFKDKGFVFKTFQP
ncbi:MAG: polysaccharide deacetylase [Clostridia bacterium]|nr:polysaccharide deacetylase [Clostridia bacterium]